MKHQFLLFLALIGLSLGACKRTVEGEQTAYEANKKRLEKLGAEYPGFKPAFQTMLAEADPAWKAAQAVSGEEQRIGAMADVNNKLSASYISNLADLKDKLNKLKDAKAKAPSVVTKDEDKTSLNSAIDEANITLNRIESEMGRKQANTATEVQGIVESWTRDVDAAEKRIKDIVSTYETKKEEEANKQAEATKKEEAAKAPIKCKKCGTKCEPSKGDCSKCSACGAPLAG